MIADLFFDHLGKIALAALAGIMILFALGIRDDAREHAEFTRACEQDHKPYECTAMWRAGEPSTQIVPVMIPMGR